jgi:hypothetical protein
MTTTTTTRERQPRFPLDHVSCRNLCDLARRSGYPPTHHPTMEDQRHPLYSADQLAIRLGVHPANIWPQWTDTR